MQGLEGHAGLEEAFGVRDFRPHADSAGASIDDGVGEVDRAVPAIVVLVLQLDLDLAAGFQRRTLIAEELGFGGVELEVDRIDRDDGGEDVSC